MIQEYRGFTIKEIYQSADGRGNYDYFVSSPSFVQGAVKMKTTVSKVKLYIDKKIDDLHKDLVNKAYAASGYQPTSDSIVYGDRITALNKLTDEQLLNIIAK